MISITSALRLLLRLPLLAIFFAGAASAQPDIDIADGIHLHTPKVAGSIQQYAMMSDGRFLFTAHGDATIRIWNFFSGSQAAALVAKVPVTDLQPLGEGALALRSDGVVVRIRARDHRSTAWAAGAPDPVKAIAVSPDERYVALAKAAMVEIYRTRDLTSPYRTLPFPDARAIAFPQGGGEVALGDGRGTVQRFIIADEKASGASISIGRSVRHMAYDLANNWLIVLDEGGRLFGIAQFGQPRGTIRPNMPICPDKPVAIGDNIARFEVRRRSMAEGERDAPFLLATDDSGNLRRWDSLQCGKSQGSRLISFEGGVRSPLTAAIFDYWSGNSLGNLLILEQDGTIQLARPQPGQDRARILATLVATKDKGWVIYDSARRRDGDKHTLDEIAYSLALRSAPKTDLPLSSLAGGCEQPNLLSDVREIDPPRSIGRCGSSAVPAFPDLRIVRQERDGVRYRIVFTVRLPSSSSEPSQPVVVHQGKLIAAERADLCGSLGPSSSCWRAFLFPVPNLDNEIYAQLAWHGRIAHSQLATIRAADLRQGFEHKPVIHLIMIGASHYNDEATADGCPADHVHFCNLNAPAQDFARLGKLVTARAAQGNAISVDIIQRFDGEATAAGLKSAFEAVRANIGPGDIVWLMVSGHGYYYRAFMPDDPARASEAGDFFFLPPGATFPPRTYIENHRAEVISGHLIATQLLALQTPSVLLTIHTCNAGGAFIALDHAILEALERQGSLSGISTFVSSSESRDAFDSSVGADSAIMAPIFARLVGKERLTAGDLFAQTGDPRQADPGLDDAESDQAASGAGYQQLGSDFLIYPASVTNTASRR